MAYTPKTWKTGEAITATALNALETAAKNNADAIADIQAALPTYVGANVTKKAAATYTPTTSNQTIASGQYLTGAQTIKGDANLTAGNIRKGAAIFGVTGSYEGSGSGTATPLLQSKSVTPTKAQQTVAPDAAYDGLSQVVVEAIPDDYIIPTGTKHITVNGTSDVTAYSEVEVNVPTSSGGIDTSDATATASDILSGKTAYVNGSKLTGTIASQAAQTITPGTANKTIASGKYLSGTQTIKGDANLVAGNIKSGVSIFGVSGSYAGSSGLDTSDATATANHIQQGMTAYVKGEKIVGNLPNNSNLVLTNFLRIYDYTAQGYLYVYNENSNKCIINEGISVSVRVPHSEFGDATAADVAAGKTFTSASGYKVTGTAQQGGGLVMKTGTTSSATIATGLSSIKCIVIYKTAVAGTGLVQGVWDADSGELRYTSCSSYSTWSKSYNTATSTASSASGGTFTLGLSGTNGLTSGTSYNWIAFGEA